MFQLVLIMMIKYSTALSAVSILMYSLQFLLSHLYFLFIYFLLALVSDIRLKMSLGELLLSRDL